MHGCLLRMNYGKASVANVETLKTTNRCYKKRH
jgi:hypothetical protein